MKTLTHAEKDAVRNAPCGVCHTVPPFADGSRCHPHRLVPSRGYLVGNVVPRCPSCHAAESQPNVRRLVMSARRGGLHGGFVSMSREKRAEVARLGGLKSIRRGGGWRRAHDLHPDMAREAGRKGALALNAKLTPAQMAAKMERMRAARRARQLGLDP